MNEIILNNIELPNILETGFYSAFEPFYHMRRKATFHVLILVVEGAIFVTEDEIDYQINKGELFFLKAGILHYGKVEIQKGTRWYYIHFDLPQNNILDWDFEKIKFFKQKEIPIPKKTVLGENTSCEILISQIVNDFHSTDAEKLWNINAKFFGFFSELLRFNGESIFRKKEQSEKISYKIQKFLEKNCEKKFSVADIEATFFLSYKRLAAIFKNETGENMQSFHTKCKINMACNLLRTTTMNINEVGREVGFEDQLYFSRVFKAHTGTSPTLWRKNIKY